MNIIGICTFFHDSSACLVQDGKLVAFAEEERFDRQKRSSAYPYNPIEYCMQEGGISLRDVDAVAYNVQPLQYLLLNIGIAIRNFPWSLNLLKPGAANMPLGKRIRSMFTLKSIMRQKHNCPDAAFHLHYVPHHMSHIGAAFFVSPFDEAAVLSIDAAGEGISTAIFKGKGHRIQPMGENGAVSRYPHSLAGFYSGVTDFLGFRVGTDEYKVMGLSAYGEPEFRSKFEQVIYLDNNGKLNLALDFFGFHTGGANRFYGPKMVEIFGPPREPESEITERHRNLSASIQKTLEDKALEIVYLAYKLTGSKNLCLAGGVALNCLMNKRIIEEGPFENVYVMPIASDAGGSIGSAYYVYNEVLNNPRSFILNDLYLGPGFSETDYKEALEERNVSYKQIPDIEKWTAQFLANGNIVGWFQGKMEGGPRALGNRSLLADPRRADMKDIINSRIKSREFFRPFAPSVIEERAGDYFDTRTCSPYMIVVSDVRPEKKNDIPAVTHVDGTARVQTVSKKSNPKYHALLEEFGRLTGVPVLLNTSFNEREPIVCTPHHAVDCFLRVGIDALVMGNFLALKN